MPESNHAADCFDCRRGRDWKTHGRAAQVALLRSYERDAEQAARKARELDRLIADGDAEVAAHERELER